MEITINGVRAELGNSYPAISKKSFDIENPSARFIDITNEFQLPDTQINREIFGSPQAIGSNNRSFDKLYDVVISDVFQIFRGKGYLDSTSKDVFSLQVIDPSKDLFNSLDILLNKISWDDLDIYLDQTNINALDTIDIDSCWFWGKACLHEDALQVNTDQTTGDARCKYSRPSFYVQGLLNRALTQNGYTFTSIGTDLAFSPWHQDFFFTSYQKTLSATYSPSGSLALTGLTTNDFAHSDLTVATGSINIGTKRTKFRLRGNFESDATISIIFRATDNVDATKITESKLTLGATSQDVDFETSEFQSDNGMTVDIRFVGTGSVDANSVLLYTLLSDKYEDLSTNPWLDYMIKAYDNLPELTYLDLYRLICITSNQYHIIDTYSKTFTFGEFSSLNKINAKDWSDKFVINSENITSNFSNLYQKNYLKYDNDIYVNSQLGESYFLTDNERLEAEGDYIKLAFGASNDVTINSNDIAHIPVYDDTTRIADQEINIRLFAAEDSRIIFDPISWENISSDKYANYFNSLYRIRYIECNIDLKKLDILQWNEGDLIYIDYFKTMFIVLEINNFIPGTLTNVKLLAYGR